METQQSSFTVEEQQPSWLQQRAVWQSQRQQRTDWVLWQRGQSQPSTPKPQQQR